VFHPRNQETSNLQDRGWLDVNLAAMFLPLIQSPNQCWRQGLTVF